MDLWLSKFIFLMVDLDPEGKQFQVGYIQSYARILDLNFPPFNLKFVSFFRVIFFCDSFQYHGIQHHEKPAIWAGICLSFFPTTEQANLRFFSGIIRVKDEEDAQTDGKTPQTSAIVFRCGL